MTLIGDERQWFAVQVAPQHERKVATILAHKNYQEFFPIRTVTHKWSDRIKVLEEPLFPGYVFCRTMQTALRPVLATSGVVRIVGFGGKPYPISEEEIAAIQGILSAGLEPLAVTRPKIGQRIQICEGPLKGLIGILTRINNQNHLVVSIDAIMKSIAIIVDIRMVVSAQSQPVGDAKEMRPKENAA